MLSLRQYLKLFITIIHKGRPAITPGGVSQNADITGRWGRGWCKKKVDLQLLLPTILNEIKIISCLRIFFRDRRQNANPVKIYVVCVCALCMFVEGYASVCVFKSRLISSHSLSISNFWNFPGTSDGGVAILVECLFSEENELETFNSTLSRARRTYYWYGLLRDGSKFIGYPGRDHRQGAQTFFEKKLGVQNLKIQDFIFHEFT